MHRQLIRFLSTYNSRNNMCRGFSTRILIYLCALMYGTSMAKTTPHESLTQSKRHLKQLETKISQLQHAINSVHDQKQHLKNALIGTEKKLTEMITELRKIQHEIHQQQAKIDTLKIEITQIDHDLKVKQHRLMQQVQTRYHLDDKTPFKWLFIHQHPTQIDRLLTYNRYVIQANQQLMTQVIQAQHALVEKQRQLNEEMQQLTQKKQRMQRQYEQFERDKKTRGNLLTRLSQDLQHKQERLNVYQVNRTNLTRLITQLTQQSVIQTRRPLTQMRQKLIHPISTNPIKHRMQKSNQGVLFFAPEGTPVRAVYPGKIVFSDWLNGYGFLSIIDHGWGFMSLYANNQLLIKRKGETVQQGEQIAVVGHTGGFKQSGLYFEIRHHGKASPPMSWLQK